MSVWSYLNHRALPVVMSNTVQTASPAPRSSLQAVAVQHARLCRPVGLVHLGDGPAESFTRRPVLPCSFDAADTAPALALCGGSGTFVQKVTATRWRALLSNY
jgi:hypothetical protein